MAIAFLCSGTFLRTTCESFEKNRSLAFDWINKVLLSTSKKTGCT